MAEAKKHYQGLPFIQLQFDGWSDSKGNRYIGIAIIWVDPITWELNVACGGVMQLPGVHSTAAMREFIVKVITKFGLSESHLEIDENGNFSYKMDQRKAEMLGLNITDLALLMYDNAEKEVGKAINAASRKPCGAHNLVLALRYGCGHKLGAVVKPLQQRKPTSKELTQHQMQKLKEKIMADEADHAVKVKHWNAKNNQYFNELTKKARKLVRLYSQSTLRHEQLDTVQEEFQKEGKYPYSMQANTAINDNNSGKPKKRLLKVLGDNETRWNGQHAMFARLSHLEVPIKTEHSREAATRVAKAVKAETKAKYKAQVMRTMLTDKEFRLMAMVKTLTELPHKILKAMQIISHPTYSFTIPAARSIVGYYEFFQKNMMSITVPLGNGSTEEILYKDSPKEIQDTIKCLIMNMYEYFPWLSKVCVCVCVCVQEREREREDIHIYYNPSPLRNHTVPRHPDTHSHCNLS